MKALGTGIINLFLLPFRIFKSVFSFMIGPLKFISEQIEFEKNHEMQRKKFFSARKRLNKSNDEII